MTDLTAPRFTDPDAAREHLEAIRWPDGPVCPHCGSFDHRRMEGSAHRRGLIHCRDCRGQYSVTVGTVFERSKVPLNKWVMATHLLCSSKKGISSHQLSRMLGVQYKTAWFMAHRIREAMVPTIAGPMGGGGTMVEADETFFGRVPGNSRKATENMNKIVSLIDHATGRATSIVFEGSFSAASIGPILAMNMSPNAILMTDGAHHYKRIGKEYAGHEYVDHAKDEYVRRGASHIHTNTIEGFFGIFKRGMKGIYQHCGSQHLQRYLAEFDFRYSNRVACGVNDDDRTDIALRGIEGKRLTYRRIGGLAA